MIRSIELKTILRSYNLNVSGTKEVLIERLIRHFDLKKDNDLEQLTNGDRPVRLSDEMAKMKEKMESMQRIMEEQKREIQKLKSTGNEVVHNDTDMPIPSHVVAFKKGIQQHGFKLNRRIVFSEYFFCINLHKFTNSDKFMNWKIF